MLKVLQLCTSKKPAVSQKISWPRPLEVQLYLQPLILVEHCMLMKLVSISQRSHSGIRVAFIFPLVMMA